MRQKIFYSVLVFAALGAGIGYYMYNKPLDKMGSLAVDETVSAEALFTAYESDEKAAKQNIWINSLL